MCNVNFNAIWPPPSPAKHHYALTSEISIQGEGDGTGCAVVNQLWAWLILNHEKCFTVKQKTILQLIENCTCGTIPFPLYRDFPVATNCWSRGSKLERGKDFSPERRNDPTLLPHPWPDPQSACPWLYWRRLI